MATTHSNTTLRRPGGKDEPEDLRQLRQEHGASLATLKELFADWSEEDLLYAIQDAGGDLELTILRISDGKSLPYSLLPPSFWRHMHSHFPSLFFFFFLIST